jgi:hypothetical protein
MKKLLYTLPFLLLLTGCYEQERKCADFKTGKFSFEAEINGVKKTTIFERTETLQIETYEGKTDTASVRWVNDCEFVLQKLHPKNMQEKKGISMRILTTHDNSYIFEYSLVGEPEKQKGTVTKIN